MGTEKEIGEDYKSWCRRSHPIYITQTFPNGIKFTKEYVYEHDGPLENLRRKWRQGVNLQVWRGYDYREVREILKPLWIDDAFIKLKNKDRTKTQMGIPYEQSIIACDGILRDSTGEPEKNFMWTDKDGVEYEYNKYGLRIQDYVEVDQSEVEEFVREVKLQEVTEYVEDKKGRLIKQKHEKDIDKDS